MNDKPTKDSDPFEDNKPVVGGLYMWAAGPDEHEMAIIICEILDDEYPLPICDELTTNGLTKKSELKLAYKLNILLNMPHREKVKYHIVTISHKSWHKYATRKA